MPRKTVRFAIAHNCKAAPVARHQRFQVRLADNQRPAETNRKRCGRRARTDRASGLFNLCRAISGERNFPPNLAGASKNPFERREKPNGAVEKTSSSACRAPRRGTATYKRRSSGEKNDVRAPAAVGILSIGI